MKSVIETFRPVRGYEGIYEISDCGAVRSLYGGKVKYLRNAKQLDGYEHIDLFCDGKRKHFFVHRLVWEAFVGKIPDGYEIDHINTIRDDNRLVNLRVVTPKENMANQITSARHREAQREAGKLRSQDPKWREAVREANRRLSKDPQWIEATREGNRKIRNKPVLQLDKSTGEVIREWECTADAWRELGIDFRSISACCRGKRNSAGGFKWEFA